MLLWHMPPLIEISVYRRLLVCIEFFDAALSARSLAPAIIYSETGTKPRRNLRRMCTYKITDLTSFK